MYAKTDQKPSAQTSQDSGAPALEITGKPFESSKTLHGDLAGCSAVAVTAITQFRKRVDGGAWTVAVEEYAVGGSFNRK